MPDRIARVWSGTEWESITSPTVPANSVVYYQATSPSSPVTGQAWFDSSTNILKVYSGSSWISTTIDLSSYATQSYVGNAANIPTLDSTKVPTISINTQTESYTLVLTDAGKLIYIDSSIDFSLTIPTNSSVAYPIGTKIDIVQAGVGVVTVSPESGVTMNSESSKTKILARYCGASLVKTSTDTWILLGALKT